MNPNLNPEEHKFCRGGNIYSTKKLWEVTSENETYQIETYKLTHVLQNWLWAEGTPYDVYHKNISDEEDHHERILKADTSYPILICESIILPDFDPANMINTFDLLDGLHRLCKMHYIEKREFVTVKKVTKEQLEQTRRQ